MKDHQRIQAFRRSQRYINGILSLFEKVGFSVESVYDKEQKQPSWGAILQPSEDLAQELGSRTEMLLWVDAYDIFDARSLQRIQDALSLVRPRLREDIVFFVSRDPKASVAIAALPSDSTIVALSVDQLKTFSSSTGPDFRRHLLSNVFGRDPYRFAGAVTSHWQFFGRARIITDLMASASSGERIGLFGLRKIGKTSLLLRVIDQLRAVNANMIVGHLQVARVDAIRRTAAYFLWSLGQAIQLGIPKTINVPHLRLFGRHGVFTDILSNDVDNILDLFLHDINQILKRQSTRLCLVFDEIERMWPSAREPSTSQWASEFPKVWQLLRSLDQEYPSRVSIVVAGTNPQCVEESHIGGRENPLFQYIQIRYLPFLDKDDAFLLLKSLGDRAGLRWNEEACRVAYDQVSGHPALLRVLGSVVYAEGREHERRRVVHETNVGDATAATRRESGPVLNEICGALREGYPDDFLLLECLSQNRLGEFRQYSAAFPDAMQHLLGFGLLNGGSSASVSFSLLQTHIQLLGREKPPASTPSMLPDMIGNYKIVASLGRAGGFGRVFTGKSVSGELVAIKVLHSSSLAALNREVDILKEMKHENIVRFIDSGYDSYGNHIVMEHLEGQSWMQYCSRSTRMNARDAKGELVRLLKALRYFHPRADESSEERRELTIQEILARRFGYIHRDIKPENIISVPRRGPVLIDFGIASKSGDPTRTTTATPGYLPPGFVGGIWDADIDLYQLGVTFVQVLVGELYQGNPEQLVDLRLVLEKDDAVVKRVSNAILKMCDPDKTNRFKAATEALAYLGVVLAIAPAN